MKTEVIQNCGCVIYVYSDGSAGGAEIGEWCALHRASPLMLRILQTYLAHFDDEDESDAEMKRWLDRNGIPAMREAVESAGAESEAQCSQD